MSIEESHPLWWSPKHTSAWARTKTAIRRDWEQTKHDLTGGGHDLNQDAGDTMRQAGGTVATPLGNVPNLPDAHDVARHARDDATNRLKEAKLVAAERAEVAKADYDADINAANEREMRWERSEKAVRYGFGAAMTPHREWTASRSALRDEWTVLGGGRTWDDAEGDVRQGWEGARKTHAEP